MTNCSPQQFVLPGQMARRCVVSWLEASVLILAALLVVRPTITEAQEVHPACLDDGGNPVEPLRGEGAWAIILNFNHPKSTQETVACWAVVETMDPVKTVAYTPGIRCQIINNVNNVKVGAGKAPFDGNFHIRCPRRDFDPDPNALYDTFYVHTKAQFPEVESSYTLIKHRDVEVRAGFAREAGSSNWRATLVSRYGGTSFADSETVSMVPGHRIGFSSTILNGEGTHHINRDLVESRRPVANFSFDFSEPILIGGGGTSWTLYNLILDPPPPDTTFN